MLSWLSIVFWILTNIPTFMNLISTILGIIHTIPKSESLSIQSALSGAIQTGDKQTVQKTLEFHAGMVGTPPTTV